MENISYIQTLYKHRIRIDYSSFSSYTDVTQISKITSNYEVFPLIIFYRLIRKKLTINKIKLFLDKAKYNSNSNNLGVEPLLLSIGINNLSKLYDVLGNYEIYDNTDKVRKRNYYRKRR